MVLPSSSPLTPTAIFLDPQSQDGVCVICERQAAPCNLLPWLRKVLCPSPPLVARAGLRVQVVVSSGTNKAARHHSFLAGHTPKDHEPVTLSFSRGFLLCLKSTRFQQARELAKNSLFENCIPQLVCFSVRFSFRPLHFTSHSANRRHK